MIFSRFIKSLFIFCTAVLWGFSTFGQITDPLQKEAEKTLREKLSKTKPDTDRVQTELYLAQVYLVAGIIKPAILDSMNAVNIKAEALCRQLHSVKWLNEVMKSKVEYYAEIGDSTEAEACIRAVVNSSATQRDKFSIAEAWNTMGDVLPPWSNALIREKISCFTNAKKLFLQIDNKQYAAGAIKGTADAHLVEGKYDLAEKELFQALNVFKTLHFKNLYDTYYLISRVYYNKGNMHQALYYSLETIKNMRANGDTTNAPLFYMKISSLYAELGIYDKAILYDKKVLNGPWDETEVSVAVNRLVKILVRENKSREALKLLTSKIISTSKLTVYTKVVQNESLAICYLALGQYKQAQIFVDKLLQAAGDYRNLLDSPMETNLDVYNIACNLFLATKNYPKAKYYLQQIQQVSKGYITASYRSNMEMYLSKIDSADGNYLSALKHFQAHKFLSDSLFNATKSKQIEELQISYETRQKDADLALLKKQSQIQRTSIANKSMVANFMIVGFILLTIIIAGLYNRYLVNKRYNVVLEGTQMEIAGKNIYLEKLLADNEWLLREVHHRVKNNLHIIMGLLQSQSAYLEDGIALNAVRDSRNRVQSMALIHQKLYMTINTSDIYMPEFVTELVDNLKDSFDTGLNIYFQLEVAPIIMDASYVVPVGLILNEAITNAIKHAFPHSDQDTIKISLTSTDTSEVTITITDNGKGINPNADISRSFGMQLISGLVHELGGKLAIDGHPGTGLLINFKTVHASKPN